MEHLRIIVHEVVLELRNWKLSVNLINSGNGLIIFVALDRELGLEVFIIALLDFHYSHFLSEIMAAKASHHSLEECQKYWSANFPSLYHEQVQTTYYS